MLLRIQYKDHSYDMIEGRMLDRLISDQRIERFQRSSGWVTIGVDSIRRVANSAYEGEERRADRTVVLH